MKTVYKAFLRDKKGRLTSIIASGKALTVYPMRMQYGRKWLTELGYLPTGFRSKNSAFWFAKVNASGQRWEVWRCSTHETRPPLHIGFLDSLCLHEILECPKKSDGLFTWPKGTVFCKGIKPLEKVESNQGGGA